MKENKSPLCQTKKIRIRVDDHLLIPFGCPKWDIEKINLTCVSTETTYFESETPCVYINKTKKEPLSLRQCHRVFPKEFPQIEEHEEAYNFLKEHIKEYTDDRTPFENRFLDLYFEYCHEAPTTLLYSWKKWYNKQLSDPRTYYIQKNLKGNEPNIPFDALLPLPQAHLYLRDPLKSFSIEPTHMIKMDFAFWTGEQIIAIEIDHSTQVSSEKLLRDRMLQRAGVPVFHILNSELMEYGTKTIEKLLPKEITEYWWNITDIGDVWEFNPLSF